MICKDSPNQYGMWEFKKKGFQEKNPRNARQLEVK